MRNWTLLLLLIPLFMWGCTASSPETGNTTRTYKDIAPMKITNSGENAYTVITITSDLTGSSQQDQEVGDISTEASPVLTAAWEAAQAMGAKDGMAFMKDIAPILEKWLKIDEDNSQNTSPEPGGGGDDTGEAPDPGGGDSDGDGDDGESDGSFDPSDYDLVEEASCDQEMSFRDDSESTGIIQKKCVFTKPGPTYGESFVVQWSSGNTLDVRDSSSMQWLVKNPETGEKDYRKYHPHEPNHDGFGGYVPGSPAEVYAGRGDNSTRAMILVKKTEGPGSKIRIVWADHGCKDPDSSHDRFCWTKINDNSSTEWSRKFAFEDYKWLDDKPYSMNCEFSDGTSLYVPNTMKMAMEPGGPKYRHQDGNQEPKKTHPKIAGRAGADPEWVECVVDK